MILATCREVSGCGMGSFQGKGLEGGAVREACAKGGGFCLHATLDLQLDSPEVLLTSRFASPVSSPVSTLQAPLSGLTSCLSLLTS